MMIYWKKITGVKGNHDKLTFKSSLIRKIRGKYCKNLVNSGLHVLTRRLLSAFSAESGRTGQVPGKVDLDRDGTINKLNGFITKPEGFELIDVHAILVFAAINDFIGERIQ